jgi:hypothetical protein
VIPFDRTTDNPAVTVCTAIARSRISEMVVLFIFGSFDSYPVGPTVGKKSAGCIKIEQQIRGATPF